MIVTSHNEKIQMFTQYDHSKLSGDFVPYWQDQLFIGQAFSDEVKLAIREHDRAWIPLDEEPIWNYEKKVPHSFMDYPMKPKIEAYKKGIDEVEQQSNYAAYLNSQHFLSFFDQDSTDPDISRFISREIDRQNRLEQTFSSSLTNEINEFHFNLLQFCDDLSLYICLNEPGTSKENEIFMFKDGFRQRFAGLSGSIRANWVTINEITLTPFPFKEPFHVQVPYREITHEQVEEKGLVEAYQHAETHNRIVLIKGE
ncbi:DUF3891 family protein [Filobacillus milosensis]|uniref:DUF3891 family protein n=1 Tax=Filobacillus milosensis TaxID=94137 RepID=A0A4Y8IRM6_9BACI|nr:DUF3891 family protein [Filobacillus milosensis]TFB21070.1 DUF3891 family protein [Filobacillus milosensis]